MEQKGERSVSSRNKRQRGGGCSNPISTQKGLSPKKGRRWAFGLSSWNTATVWASTSRDNSSLSIPKKNRMSHRSKSQCVCSMKMLGSSFFFDLPNEPERPAEIGKEHEEAALDQARARWWMGWAHVVTPVKMMAPEFDLQTLVKGQGCCSSEAHNYTRKLGQP